MRHCVFQILLQTSPLAKAVQGTSECLGSCFELLGSLTVCEEAKVAAHHTYGVDPMHRCQGGCDVEETCGCIESTGFNIRSFEDQRYPQQLVIERMAVLEPAVFPEFLSMVAHDHDRCTLVEVIKNPLNLIIEIAHVVVVSAAHICLARLTHCFCRSGDIMTDEVGAVELFWSFSREQIPVLKRLGVREVHIHQLKHQE